MPVQISRILHAGYLFQCDGVDIAFDPIFENPFSRNCHAFPGVAFDHGQIKRLRLAAVFISHYHDDHCSLDSLDLLPRDTPIYMYCLFDELFAMLGELGFVNVHQLRTNVPVSVGPFEVIAREALDADVDSMFQVRAAGMNILNVVDSWIAPPTVTQLAAEGPWDMVLWPFQTMREMAVIAPSRSERTAPSLPDEFIEQLRELNPRFVVPSSCQFVQEPWSWYNHAMFPITYAQFQREVEAALPAARVVRLNPSVSVLLDAGALAMAPSLGWVVPVGEQDLDFQFDQDLQPPPTAEIARHFPALNGVETARVLAWCEDGLIEKYRAMELPADSYFEQPRVWRLSLYDHRGEPIHFSFRVCGDSIDPIANDAMATSWLTEVPIAKLFAALERGESLTSMYVRINDALFDADTEADLQTADLIDDPLIRCLFNDVFGAYQAAQLKRLQTKQ